MFNKKNSIENKIQELRNRVDILKQNAAKAENIAQYMYNVRIPFNYALIEAATGATFEKNKKGEWEMRFPSAQPTKEQLYTVSDIANRWAYDEYNTVQQLLQQSPAAGGDMAINEFAGGIAGGCIEIPANVSVKELKQLITEGQTSWMKRLLDGSSVLAISAIVEKAVMHRTKIRCITFGAIGLGLITGGIGTAVLLNRRHKEEEDREQIESHEDSYDESLAPAVVYDELPIPDEPEAATA